MVGWSNTEYKYGCLPISLVTLLDKLRCSVDVSVAMLKPYPEFRTSPIRFLQTTPME